MRLGLTSTRELIARVDSRSIEQWIAYGALEGWFYVEPETSPPDVNQLLRMLGYGR